MKMLSYIGNRIPNNPNAGKSSSNILLKSFLVSNSDKKQTVGCLRQKEKFSVTYELMS